MRICYIASTIEIPYRTGLGSGGSTHTCEVTETLASMGDEVHVLCRRSFRKQAKTERQRGMVIHRMFCWDSAVYGFLKSHALLWKAARIPYYAFRAILDTLRILRLARKERFAVIYERSAASALAGTCTAWILRTPLVLEINDQDYQPLALSVARKIVTPELKMIPLHARKKASALEWGVNTLMFHPNIDGNSVRREYGIEQREVILFVGSGLPWHGLREIVEAAPFVLRAAARAVFLIVGGSSEIEDWKRVVKQRGLQEWFRFTGAIEYAKVPAYVATADIALAPYNSHLAEHDRHRFASPLKVLEYMAAGKALVVTRVANVRQTIEDGLTGLVVPEDSADALAVAILQLLQSPGLRRTLGANARAAAEAKFSWAKHCSLLRELFVEAVRSAHAKEPELLSEAKV